MRGTLCISIDLELAWGVWDRPTREYLRLCAERERDIVRRLLATFQRYEVAATWAIVGRLLDGRAPAPVPSAEGRRIWYAPDVVDAIRRTVPTQEIGSHSFAHIYCAHATRDAMRADLDAARTLHARHGLAWSAFVFPRNQVAHVDLLLEAGLRVYRSRNAGWAAGARARTGSMAGRLANLFENMLPIAPAAVSPRIVAGGLVELPGSMLLLGRSGARRLVRPGVAGRRARLGMRAAARCGRLFHLWFHPSNFYYQTDTQFDVLDGVLRAAALARERGELDIRSMGAVAAIEAARLRVNPA